MPQIKIVATGQVLTVAQVPEWRNGAWYCGDQTLQDEHKTVYAAVVQFPLLTPVQFHNSFSVSERIKLKASADPLVQEFWKTFQLAASQPGELIDPNSAAVLGGLAYIAGATSAPAPVIDPTNQVLASAARIAQIQAGTPGGF